MNNMCEIDDMFMARANEVSNWSKDKVNKVGAVIVSNDNIEIVSSFNSFPIGLSEFDIRRFERPDKYIWTEHAERNAIFKAARIGISLEGSRMYCNYFPCHDCARAIIQSGIKSIYSNKPDLNHKRWGDSWIDALIMFKECGVEVIWMDNEQV